MSASNVHAEGGADELERGIQFNSEHGEEEAATPNCEALVEHAAPYSGIFARYTHSRGQGGLG